MTLHWLAAHRLPVTTHVAHSHSDHNRSHSRHQSQGRYRGLSPQATPSTNDWHKRRQCQLFHNFTLQMPPNTCQLL